MPKGTVPYRRLLPLYEVLSYATGVRRLYAKRVLEQQDAVIRAFGSEFSVLLEASHEQLTEAAGSAVADALIMSREGRVRVTPGFDGEYGVPMFS